jgi:DnaJ like chaperone protein
MSFWKNLAQLAVRHFDPAECIECPKGPPGQDPAFATAVTALGAKLAMADGMARESEQKAFFDVFQADAQSEANVLKLYQLARQTPLGFESYAKRLAKRYAKCADILEDVLEGLFHIAVSDGALSDTEETYLETVASLFAIKPHIYRRIKAGYAPLGPEDPYTVLGLSPYAGFDEIKVARNRLLNDFHPDRLAVRGLPEAFHEVYTQKTATINAAYAQIMRESTV